MNTLDVLTKPGYRSEDNNERQRGVKGMNAGVMVAAPFSFLVFPLSRTGIAAREELQHGPSTTCSCTGGEVKCGKYQHPPIPAQYTTLGCTESGILLTYAASQFETHASRHDDYLELPSVEYFIRSVKDTRTRSTPQ